jgi:hypothetical protein
MNEEWKPVPKWPLYIVSNFGRIKNVVSGRILKAPLNNNGRPRIKLCNKGQIRDQYIHQLVMLVFVGECPEGLEINHINGDKADNRLENLEYISHLANVRHAVPRSKLLKYSVDQFVEIRKMSGAARIVAEKFGISKSTVLRIRKNQVRQWAF